MASVRTRKRNARKPVRERASPIVQAIGAGRARIDPSVLGDLLCYLLATRAQYTTQANISLRGIKEPELSRRRGQVEWARTVVQAYDLIAAHLCQTVPIREYDAARDAWLSAQSARPT